MMLVELIDHSIILGLFVLLAIYQSVSVYRTIFYHKVYGLVLALLIGLLIDNTCIQASVSLNINFILQIRKGDYTESEVIQML